MIYNSRNFAIFLGFFSFRLIPSRLVPSDHIRTQNMVTTLLNHLLEAHEAQSSLTTYKLFLFLFVLVIYYLTFFEQIW